MTTFGDLAMGQYAYHIDKGFDHGTHRAYFLQRDPVKPVELSKDGRTIVPITVYEITHFRKDVSDKDVSFNAIVLLNKGDEPRRWLVDARYQVEA